MVSGGNVKGLFPDDKKQYTDLSVEPSLHVTYVGGFINGS